MKKALFALLIAVFCIGKVSFAQTTVTIKNNTTQYFTSVLLDNTWPGGNPTSYYIDVPNNSTFTHSATVQTGATLPNASLWRGIALRTYPGGVPVTIFPFPGLPYSNTFTVAGVTYHIACSIVSPIQLMVRIDP